MFCPHCGKQNQDNLVFCAFCGKAMTQSNQPMPPPQPAIQANAVPQRASPKKPRLSFTAIKAIVTVILLVVLILIVVQIYYPGVFPWNSQSGT